MALPWKYQRSAPSESTDCAQGVYRLPAERHDVLKVLFIFEIDHKLHPLCWNAPDRLERAERVTFPINPLKLIPLRAPHHARARLRECKEAKCQLGIW